MDVIMNLRKLEFPESATRAIDYFALNLDVTKHQIPGLIDSGEEIFEQIANEFVFGLLNKSKSKFSSVEEICAVNVVLAFYSSHYERTAMFAVYRLLFYNLSSSDVKSTFFIKLLSCAVTVQNKNFLELTATWIQIHGCKSDIVLMTVKSLLIDHCTASSVSSSFKKLPSSSVLLTCHIITSITHLHSLPGQDDNPMQLTAALLDLICDWMSFDPMLCLSSLFPKYSQFLSSNLQTLWTSPTKSNNQTAIPGLIKWCTRAPFLKLPCHLQKVRLIDQEDSKGSLTSIRKSSKVKIPECLWSRLHFLVIKTISIFPKVPGSNLFELITLADVMKIVKVVSSSCNALSNEESRNSAVDLPTFCNIIQLSLDRVGQILQTSLSTGAFRCCLVDLKSIFVLLPQTRLMKIIQDHHLTGFPPPMHNAIKEFGC